MDVHAVWKNTNFRSEHHLKVVFLEGKTVNVVHKFQCYKIF